jgi:hypothetical protein
VFKGIPGLLKKVFFRKAIVEQVARPDFGKWDS